MRNLLHTLTSETGSLSCGDSDMHKILRDI